MTLRWWMPLAAGVLLVATANTVLVLAALKVRPTKVTDHPYAAEKLEDGLAADRAVWAQRGWRLEVTMHGQTATLAPLMPTPQLARVELWRANDPGLDRAMAWTDPSQPLALALAQPGRWRLRVMVEYQGQRARHEMVLETNQAP